jgi:hypothetical protein
MQAPRSREKKCSIFIARGLIDPLINKLFVEKKVKAIFECREKIVKELFKQSAFQHNRNFEKLPIHTF